MNFIYKAIATTVLFTGIFHSVRSQETSKFYTSYGFSTLADYYRAPIQEYHYRTSTEDRTYYYKSDGISILTMIYRLRYNLVDFTDNLAVGLTASPSLGFSLAGGDQGGFGVFNLPLWLSLEFGAGSTYNTTANMGGFIAAGMEYTKFPLIKSSSDFQDDFKFKTSWVQPVVATGIRFWTKNNNLREFAVKYGFGPKKPFANGSIESEPSLEKRSVTFQLSFNLFINY